MFRLGKERYERLELTVSKVKPKCISLILYAYLVVHHFFEFQGVEGLEYLCI